jgi:methyltransferase (TIGR00027 family)
VRADEASLTARGVAVARSRIDRPAWPTGDADADDRLTAGLIGDIPVEQISERARRHARGFSGWLFARTRFFDAVVIDALQDGVAQIVILGAGYDGRALRYRTPGVRYFEVDHPATQADKRRRLQEAGVALDGIVFVAADFTEPGLGDALAAVGHDASVRTQFICEGVLRYLPETAFRGLLRVARERAAPGSALAASISTRDREPTENELAREGALAKSGEAVLTVPPRAVALEWLADAGWEVASVEDALDVEESTASRGRLLVRALPARPVFGE